MHSSMGPGIIAGVVWNGLRTNVNHRRNDSFAELGVGCCPEEEGGAPFLRSWLLEALIPAHPLLTVFSWLAEYLHCRMQGLFISLL